MKSPTYGTSTHYDGESGDRYFAWQNRRGELGGEIEARKFRDIVGRGDVVLDFGCGGGNLLSALHCRRRIGVEVNPAAQSRARENGVEVFGDVGEVPAGTVDVAISNHALEHVPYPIAALRSIRRTLTPRGRIRICVPMDDWRRQRRWDPADINHHLNTWTPLLLGNTLIEAGFAVRVSDIKILTHAWPPYWDRLYPRLPTALFDGLAGSWSLLSRQRQIIADASNVDDSLAFAADDGSSGA